MPIITIYQGASGSGPEIAEAVARSLGYPCMGRDELVKAAKRFGIAEAKLNAIMEKGPSLWERLLEDLWAYRIALQGAMCEIAEGGDMVYHGHLGHELLAGIGHVLRVLVTAPMEARIRQVQGRTHRSAQEARRYIEETDRARSRRLVSMFGSDWRDPSRFDLVLNLDRMTLESARRLIVEAAHLDEFQPTPASEQRFRDFRLTAMAQAVLTASREFRGSVLHVSGEGGHIHVSGNLRYSVSEERVVRALQGIPGVTKITTDLGDFPPEMS